MFQRVRIRLTALTLAIVMALYALSAVAVFNIVHRAVMQSVDTRLLLLARSLAAGATDRQIAALPDGTWLIFQTPGRELTNASDPMEKNLRKFASHHPINRQWAATWTNARGEKTRVLYIPDKTGRSFLLVAQNIARETAVLDRLLRVFWMVGLFGLIAAALAGFFLAERALRPIHQAWKRQLEFVADASHELRTPLAVIQSNLGVVLDHTGQSVEENLEWIHNAHGESRRLAKLVQDLLTLARGDAQAMPIAWEPVNLSELVLHVRELFEPVAAMRNLHLTAEADSETVVYGDRDRLHQLLVILVDNACKFTPEQGDVHIQAVPARPGAVLKVSDTGIGIAENHLHRVFDRFFQVDEARARDGAHGTGLGLSIAKWIVDAHHGRIQVESQVDRGTSFVVTLPAGSEKDAPTGRNRRPFRWFKRKRDAKTEKS